MPDFFITNFIERQECPECGQPHKAIHTPRCSQKGLVNGWHGKKMVTVRYVREGLPVIITNEMMERATGVYFRTDGNMRAALEAAFNEST